MIGALSLLGSGIVLVAVCISLLSSISPDRRPRWPDVACTFLVLGVGLTLLGVAVLAEWAA